MCQYECNYNTHTWQELCDGFLWDEDSLDEFDDNFKGCKIYRDVNKCYYYYSACIQKKKGYLI